MFKIMGNCCYDELKWEDEVEVEETIWKNVTKNVTKKNSNLLAKEINWIGDAISSWVDWLMTTGKVKEEHTVTPDIACCKP